MIEWKIDWLQCKPVDGNLQNVVVTAGWRCNGSLGEHSATAYGSVSFSAPGDPFTPFEDLTQAQVLGWCWANGVDETAIEANVAAQLDSLANPPIVNRPLPWAQG